MNALGIGWRHPHYRELLERRPALDFLEVHSENFFAPGGAALAVLARGYAVVTRKEDGSVVSRVAQASDEMKVRVSDGEFEVRKS